jgi:hypothetical protein
MLILHEMIDAKRIGINQIWRDDTTLHQEVWMYATVKLRKYLKLDEDVEILNIHGEGFD